MEEIISNIKERILQVSENKKIAKETFFKSIGMSYGNFKGKSKETPLNSNAIADIITIYPDVNPTWLLTGKGTMLTEAKDKLDTVLAGATKIMQVSEAHNQVEEIIAVGNRLGERYKQDQLVPLYNLEAAAGMVSLFNDQSHTVPVGNISIPDLPHCDGAIFVAGDSMYPLLKSRDIVMFSNIPDIMAYRFLYGEIYIVTFDNGGQFDTCIKWVHKSDEAHCVKLVSANTHHTATDIPLDAIRQLAVVKGTIRINKN